MWLVGMMGSGKTSAGEAAARLVGVPFFDTDRMVVELARLPVSAIWSGVGEPGFRELERRVVSGVPERGFIAAAGGGAVIARENREQMRKGKPVVWLQCDPEILARRVDGDELRPLLDGDKNVVDTLTRLLAERAPWYEDVATDIVETGNREIADVVAEIVTIWEQ
jgi:shikimate kinase